MTAAFNEPRLGDASVRDFLRRHWQRQPLLIRQALPGLLEPAAGAGAKPASSTDQLFPTRELFALARDPEVESRLVFAPPAAAATAAAAGGRSASPARGGGWKLRHGPFARLPSRQKGAWTLLVQGVDLHLPQARALMDRFRFIPDARLDDLMISFATDGGGVGPHVDSYDVFLLQVHGRRRWRIAAPAPARLVPDAPLRILADFEPARQWLLEPGDMLYLPPGWGHEGTAVGECMTCSIGFRSPSASELRQAFYSYLAEQPPAADGRAERRYRDRTMAPVPHPAQIPEDMAKTLGDWLQSHRPSTALVHRFLGCYLTEPKPSVWFEPPDPAQPGFADGVPLVLDRRTRMLYRERAFFINGEPIELPRAAGAAGELLRALADRRRLDAVQTARAIRHPWLRDTLEEWLASGWIRRAGS